MGTRTKKLIDFLEKSGIPVKVDYNPSEEKVAEIKKKIETNEQKVKDWVAKHGQELIKDINDFNERKKNN